MINVLDGFKIKKIREAKIPFLTQTELGYLSGLDQSTINKIESGSNSNPNTCTTIRLAKALEVSVYEIILEKNDCCD